VMRDMYFSIGGSPPGPPAPPGPFPGGGPPGPLPGGGPPSPLPEGGPRFWGEAIVVAVLSRQNNGRSVRRIFGLGLRRRGR
jgi:hypothetical protein